MAKHESSYVERECPIHGLTRYRSERPANWHHQYRCIKCASERTVERKRKTKQSLVEEAGGQCEVCGYHRSMRALHFHHRDPALKTLTIAHTNSPSAMRQEAQKCVLLCANCHAEVEDGLIAL